VKMPLDMAFLIEHGTQCSVLGEQLRPGLGGPITRIREDSVRSSVQKDAV